MKINWEKIDANRVQLVVAESNNPTVTPGTRGIICSVEVANNIRDSFIAEGVVVSESTVTDSVIHSGAILKSTAVGLSAREADLFNSRLEGVKAISVDATSSTVVNCKFGSAKIASSDLLDVQFLGPIQSLDCKASTVRHLTSAGSARLNNCKISKVELETLLEVETSEIEACRLSVAFARASTVKGVNAGALRAYDSVVSSNLADRVSTLMVTDCNMQGTFAAGTYYSVNLASELNLAKMSDCRTAQSGEFNLSKAIGAHGAVVCSAVQGRGTAATRYEGPTDYVMWQLNSRGYAQVATLLEVL